MALTSFFGEIIEPRMKSNVGPQGLGTHDMGSEIPRSELTDAAGIPLGHRAFLFHGEMGFVKVHKPSAIILLSVTDI